MIIKTRSLTESLEKKYGLNEAYEYETDDELDYIMDDDSLSDDEKEDLISDTINKYNSKNEESLNESFVEEWWGQTEEDPFEFAYNYGLTCAKIGRRGDETLYRFTGEKEDIKKAIKDGYFYTMEMGYEDEDEGHSSDLDESLTEARLNENPVLASVARAVAPTVISAAADKLTDVVTGDLSEDVDDPNFQWFVGDNQSGYMYPNEEVSLNIVKKLIDDAKNTEGCEIISIVVVPEDGAGNEL